MSHFISLNPPLLPRKWQILRVLIVARISTEHQDVLSLNDQEAKCRAHIEDHYSDEIEFTVIASRGSGEYLDRKELAELEEKIESREFDVVISEDLSRICRRLHAYAICEMCNDSDTRLIAINDRVDTAVRGWEDSALMSTWHHERSNRDTADRIRRSLNNRFDLGGVVQFIIFGYIKPPGAKSDSDLRKDPEAEPIIKEIFHRLNGGASYAEVADWLNSQGVPPGPYCRTPDWTREMVSRFVHHPILKGVRIRNRKMTQRVNKTGRRKTVRGKPGDLRKRNCPHLAFVEAEYYDRVIQRADEKNRPFRRADNGVIDPRLGIPRKRTQFPGQHAKCGICGRILHWHSDKRGLKIMVCSGATDYLCWNSLYVNGEECTRRIIFAAISAISELPGFDAVFGELVRESANELEDKSRGRREQLEKQQKDVDGRLANLIVMLEQRPDSTALLGRMDDLESQKAALARQLYELKNEPMLQISLPDASELRRRAVVSLQESAADDLEAYRLLCTLIPEVLIVPYQVCDERDIIAKAEITVSLTSLLPSQLRNQAEAKVFTRHMVVDLMDPPQRIQHCQAAMALEAQGLQQREIGANLGIYQSAVQAALRVGKIMETQGLKDPYLRLTALPEKTHKLKRFKHPRFKFEPLEGFPRHAD